MGLSEWLRKQYGKLVGKPSRPRRSIANKLRAKVIDLTDRLQSIERDRDERQIALRAAETAVARLELDQRDNEATIRRLQEEIGHKQAAIDAAGSLIAYYEQRIQTQTAIEAARAARATHGQGAFDVQSLVGRD